MEEILEAMLLRQLMRMAKTAGPEPVMELRMDGMHLSRTRRWKVKVWWVLRSVRGTECCKAY